MRWTLALALATSAVIASLGPGCTKDGDAPPADAYVNLDAPAHTGAGNGGGLLDNLTFAIVGDTRPMNIDDTAHYPTDVITKIWADVAAQTPAPAFAVTTGDYMYAATNFSEQDPQLDIYLQARSAYSGIAYPAMGNHECNGFTDSNCGSDQHEGETQNYLSFMTKLVQPLGVTEPYFIERFAATDGSWSAKVIVIAANAWTGQQEAWLSDVLGEPTTYTFVIRHEPNESNTAPGVPSSQALMALHPLTLLIVGHSHLYAHDAGEQQLVVGTGGAPLTSGADYGYVMCVRNPDGTLTFTAYDYLSLDIVDTFTINPDGSPH